MNTIRIEEIRRAAPDQYDVLIVFENGREAGRFTFMVDRGDIDVLTWSPEFSELMHKSAGAAKAIFAAIMAVDRARAAIPE